MLRTFWDVFNKVKKLDNFKTLLHIKLRTSELFLLTKIFKLGSHINRSVFQKKIAMVAMEQSHKSNGSEGAITTVQGTDEGRGRAAKKRHKSHLGYLKIRKRKGSRCSMFN